MSWKLLTHGFYKGFGRSYRIIFLKIKDLFLKIKDYFPENKGLFSCKLVNDLFKGFEWLTSHKWRAIYQETGGALNTNLLGKAG